MRALFVIALLLAGPAQAMTSEDCKRIQSTFAKTIPAVGEIRIAPSVSADGWCRVIDGPIGSGLEWRVNEPGQRFLLEIRQQGLSFDELGPFDVTGRVEAASDGSLRLGPFRFATGPDDLAILSAVLVPPEGGDSEDFTTLPLAEAVLQVTGARGLVDDILAWAFRQDLAAARSSFIAARDQRDYMLDWLNDDALSLIDPASADAFRDVVAAYPRARGTARLSIREGAPVQIGGLVAAVLFGARFSRAEAARLIEEAGLRFAWQPG